MLFPLVVALVAVALGAWVALGVRDGAESLGPIRVIALVAALATIILHLLPESFHDLGVLAFAGVAAGAAMPWVLQRGIVAISRNSDVGASRGQSVALEASYAGLFVHRFGDGVSMGAYSASPHDRLSQAGVVLALAAHIVPVTTVMILAVDEQNGRKSAVIHAVGLAAATMAGVVAAAKVLSAVRPDWAPWVSAIVAGLLLHVVLHEARLPAIFRA